MKIIYEYKTITAETHKEIDSELNKLFTEWRQPYRELMSWYSPAIYDIDGESISEYHYLYQVVVKYKNVLDGSLFDDNQL
jgi:sugar-specific transcriptional regulator TrmB